MELTQPTKINKIGTPLIGLILHTLQFSPVVSARKDFEPATGI